jgi:hypothetical protein
MKAAARKEAAIGKDSDFKPANPKIPGPGRTDPAGRAGSGGMGGLLFDEQEIRKRFAASKAAGVELKDVQVVTKDGWRHAYITSTCRDLGATRQIPAGGGQDGSLGLSKDSDGNYVMVIAHPQFGRMSAGNSAADDVAEHQRARKAMPGFRMSVTIAVPGDLVKTNAHKTSGRTASWVLDIEDEKFPQKCRALNRQGMSVTFEGDGLELKTFKPAVAR